MTSLLELQRAFCGAILSGDAAAVAALIRSDGIPASQRVQIYRNNTQSAFLATLAATYPVIARLGGADWFRQSAMDYHRLFPSRSGDLQFAGDRYGEFLRTRFAGAEFEYFCDVAALEWAYQEVLTAADEPPIDPQTLGSVADEDHGRIVFVIRPAVRLVRSKYPVFAIWKANQPGVDTPGVDTPGVATPGVDQRVSAGTGGAISLDAGGSCVLVIRRAEFVELREVPASTATLFEQFLGGASFASAASAFAKTHAETALGDALRELITLQVIAGYRCN